MPFIRKEVRTKRLIIRPLVLKDYPAWFETVTNSYPAQSRWDRELWSKEKCTKKFFKDRVEKQVSEAAADDYYVYFVFEKKTGAMVGLIDFNIFLRDTHQFANYGYVIFNRHWGKGFGQEAAKAGLKIGFNQLKLNRLEAAINLDNRKSIRLAKQIGMRKEGIKKNYWFEDGRWVDHLIYVVNPADVGLKATKPF